MLMENYAKKDIIVYLLKERHENEPGKYLEVLYARILVRNKKVEKRKFYGRSAIKKRKL